MTADEEAAEQIERSRRRRERELLALLLLLLSELSRELVTLLRYGNDIQPSIARILGNGVPVIAAGMADAHVDAFGRFGRQFDPGITRRSAGTPSEVARIYTPAARDMAQAMAVAIYRGIDRATTELAPPDADVRTAARWAQPEVVVKRALQSTGYGKLNPINLELGVERNIVMASNAGMIGAGLVYTANVGRTIGLRHVSVIDAKTTIICRQRDGLTLPATDEYWFWNVPSLHSHCRSMLVPIGRDYDESDWRPTEPPEPGFGQMPAGFHALYGVSAAGGLAA